MSADEPPRLKATEGTNPELVRALQALGRRDVGSAHMAELVERLGPLLDAAPAAHLGAAGVRKLLLNKVVLACFVLGLAAVGYWAFQPTHERPVAPQPSAAVAPAPAVIAEAAGPANVAGAPAPVAEPVPPAPARTATIARRPAQPGMARRVVSSADAPSTQPSQVGPADAPAAQADEVSAVSAPEPAAKRPQPSAASTPVPRTETQLLLDARKALTGDPSTALNLLNETARRFPHGMLIPEREVLTIETLRKLGRSSEASQRLRQFESRYPDSIHLRRLQGR